MEYKISKIKNAEKLEADDLNLEKFMIFKEKLNKKLDILSGIFKNKTNSEEILVNLQENLFDYIDNVASSEEYKSNSLNKTSNLLQKRPKTNQKIEKQKNHKISYSKSILHNHGGVWFHPRELINDEILVTSGKDGKIKFWDIKDKSFNLTNQIETGSEWITSIKYDKKSSRIFCSSHSEYIYIYDYEVKENKIKLFKKLKTQLNFIYGFDLINNENISLFACSGDSAHQEKVFIYNMPIPEEYSNHNLEINWLQSIIPLQSLEDLPENKKNENYSKSLKFCGHLNLLIIGLYNGIIEVYTISTKSSVATFSYYIKLSLPDWIFQIQIANFLNKNILIASNGNCLYYISYSGHKFKIHKKKNFISSIFDFSYVTHNLTEGTLSSTDEFLIEKNCVEYVIVKIKPGFILLYDLTNEKVIEEIDETKNKLSYYNNCMIVSSKEKLILSCSDNEIFVYNSYF